MSMNQFHRQDENKIDVLSNRDAIRVNAGTYLGGANDPSNILREIVDNALDELAFVQDFNTIRIDAEDDGSAFMVTDYGRGMPIQMHQVYTDQTSAYVALTNLNAGGKFNKTRVSSGRNGVGLCTCLYLSHKFMMMVRVKDSNYENSLPEVKDRYLNNDNKSTLFYCLEFEDGYLKSESVRDINDIDLKYKIDPKASTIVYFEPDYTIIKNHTYSLPVHVIRYKAFLMKEYNNRDIHVLVNGKDIVTPIVPYKWEVKHTFKNLPKAKTNKFIDLYATFELSSDLRSRTYKGSVNSLVVNNGLHVKLVVEAIRKAIVKITGCENSYKLESGLKVRSILQAIQVDFRSQEKTDCNVIDGYSSELVDELVPDILKILEKNKKLVQDYVKRIQELDQTYRRLKDKQYIESRIKHASGSKKLTNTSRSLFAAGSTDRKKCELFICEGLSASGALAQAPQRDPMIHAIYGIRGRTLNANNMSIKATLRNDEMAKLFNIIGMGVNGFVNLKNPPYGKIIIATDADIYGGLIYSGLLANFATHASFLIQMGMVYLAESPKYQKGKKFLYESDITPTTDLKGWDALKGLGKLDPDEAGEVFFNPKTRRLIKITPEHVNKARAFLDKKSWVRRELAEKNGWLTGVFEDENSDED